MTQILRQSTAADVLIGPFLDRTDGFTAETGESPTVKLSKNGQTLGAKSDSTTPVHDADGYYNCELDATDTNTVGTLVLTVAASADALPVRHEFQVIEEAAYDAIFASGASPATTTGAVGSVTGAVGSVTGNVGGNVTGSIGSLATQAKADVNAEVDAALADYDPPTKAELDAAVLPLALEATAQDILADTAEIATVDGNVDAIKAKTDQLTFTTANRVDAQVFGMEANVISAATMTGSTGTEIAAAVWAAAARTLTAIDEDETTLDLDATIQAAVDGRFDAVDSAIAALPSAGDLSAIDGKIDTISGNVDAVKAKTDLIPGTKDGKTWAEREILAASVILAKVSGLEAGTPAFRALDDSKDRVTGTTDADGNRLTVTFDAD